MNVLRAAVALLGLALLGLVLWAALAKHELHGDFFTQFDVLTTLPWSIATIADLYVGLLLMAALMFLVERSLVSAALWAAPLLVLGNIWAALWLVIRLPRLAECLRGVRS
jgi:hypothetical protein